MEDGRKQAIIEKYAPALRTAAGTFQEPPQCWALRASCRDGGCIQYRLWRFITVVGQIREWPDRRGPISGPRLHGRHRRRLGSDRVDGREIQGGIELSGQGRD